MHVPEWVLCHQAPFYGHHKRVLEHHEVMPNGGRSEARGELAFYIRVDFLRVQVFQQDFAKGFTQWPAENHVRSLVGAGLLRDLGIFQIAVKKLAIGPLQAFRRREILPFFNR